MLHNLCNEGEIAIPLGFDDDGSLIVAIVSQKEPQVPRLSDIIADTVPEHKKEALPILDGLLDVIIDSLTDDALYSRFIDGAPCRPCTLKISTPSTLSPKEEEFIEKEFIAVPTPESKQAATIDGAEAVVPLGSACVGNACDFCEPVNLNTYNPEKDVENWVIDPAYDINVKPDSNIITFVNKIGKGCAVTGCMSEMLEDLKDVGYDKCLDDNDWLVPSEPIAAKKLEIGEWYVTIPQLLRDAYAFRCDGWVNNQPITTLMYNMTTEKGKAGQAMPDATNGFYKATDKLVEKITSESPTVFDTEWSNHLGSRWNKQYIKFHKKAAKFWSWANKVDNFEPDFEDPNQPKYGIIAEEDYWQYATSYHKDNFIGQYSFATPARAVQFMELFREEILRWYGTKGQKPVRTNPSTEEE